MFGLASQVLTLNVIVSLCQSLPTPEAQGRLSGEQASAGRQAARLDTLSLAWDRDKFQQTMVLERQKLAVEHNRTLVTTVSTAVPLFGALLTVAFGVWSLRRQADDHATAKKHEAEVQFQLKAAELVLNSPTPGVASTRARVLKALVGERLPANFVESFEGQSFEVHEPYEVKVKFWQALQQNPHFSAHALRIWAALFPKELWSKRAEEAVGAQRDQ